MMLGGYLRMRFVLVSLSRFRKGRISLRKDVEDEHTALHRRDVTMNKAGIPFGKSWKGMSREGLYTAQLPKTTIAGCWHNYSFTRVQKVLSHVQSQ